MTPEAPIMRSETYKTLHITRKSLQQSELFLKFIALITTKPCLKFYITQLYFEISEDLREQRNVETHHFRFAKRNQKI